MSQNQCNHCLSTKSVQLKCEECGDFTCKACAMIPNLEDFFYYPDKHKLNLKSIYCHACFERNIAEKLSIYKNVLAEAEQVHIFLKKQSKETRLMNRKESLIKVSDCSDEQEVFLRLAYQAVLLGFNAVIDVEPVGVKVREGSYQTTHWSGSGRPSTYNESKRVKDRSIWSQPN